MVARAALDLGAAFTFLVFAALGACERAREEAQDPLAGVHSFEAERRTSAKFASLPPSHEALGSDPYRLCAVPGGRFVGILRGRASVVLLDGDLAELDRARAPLSPSAVRVGPEGDVWVVGDLGGTLERYLVGGAGSDRANRAEGLAEAGSMALTDLRALRDLAIGPEGALHVVDERASRLVTLRVGHDRNAAWLEERRDLEVDPGPIRVLRTATRLVVVSLTGHSASVFAVDEAGWPGARPLARIVHDGPIWTAAAEESAGALVLALGGIEDRPLDRTIGSFGNVDSFVFVVRIAASGASTRLAAIDVSELGVITPKALSLDGSRVEVAGFGGDARATLHFDQGFEAPPRVETRAGPPGTSDFVDLGDGRRVSANPLLDAWVHETDEVRIVRVKDEHPPRSPESRLGEALFFTKLIAPEQLSDGALSRFTCEACHFEGGVDGRTHATGRGAIVATTQPLFGLFNNRPHFSRALDTSLTKLAHNEFRAANANSGLDPWFALSPSEHPWLSGLGVTAPLLGPEDLRRAFVAFAMDFTHRPNPATVGRAKFTPVEESGARVFEARCEGCHSARLTSDEGDSRVPRERWQALIFSEEGPIVWGRDGYEKTGIVPYVHSEGARVPSLRRLWLGKPYFTNGSARDLGTVVERARMDEARFLHGGGESDETLQPLDVADRRALLAFLDLL